jgi:hypothetical protein
VTAAGIGIIKTIVNRSKLMVVWAAALLTVPAWTADIQADGVPNFHRVNQHLYRGGQPADAGWTSLAKLGVKIVADLFFQPPNSPLGNMVTGNEVSARWVSNIPAEFWRAEIRSLSPHFRVGSSGAGKMAVRGADRTGGAQHSVLDTPVAF